MESEVYQELIAAKYKVIPQYKSCGYRIDFAVIQNGKFIAVEADEPMHFDEFGNYVKRDVERALRLMRAGWHIERISYVEWEKGAEARKQFIERVHNALNPPLKLI